MRSLTFLVCFIPFLALAQHKYVAGYEHKVSLDLSNIPIEVERPIHIGTEKYDSFTRVVMDSMLRKLKEGDQLRKMFKDQFGEEMSFYSQVRADGSKAEMEMHAGGNLKRDSRSWYENGTWRSHQTNSDSATQELRGDIDFFFTGQFKQILGYTCHEVKSKDSALQLTIWVCKDLPPTISPGLKPHNIHWAIFEYLDATNKVFIILRSLQKNQVSI